jgi:hypothetical protein
MPRLERHGGAAWVINLVGAVTPGQRLMLACQVALGMGRAEFCRRFGWSFEMHRRLSRAPARACGD